MFSKNETRLWPRASALPTNARAARAQFHFSFHLCFSRGIRVGVALLALAPRVVLAQAPGRLSDSGFAALSAALSEPSGYFDTDNLISNEDSYLHPIGTLKRIGVAGGAYVGVGPDQNFSYIAAIRPHIAFIVDVRRDNLLHHLLLKSAFGLARNRLEYLCVLFGKTAPADTTGWGARDITALLAYVDTARRDTMVVARVRTRVRASAMRLSGEDLATIARFHSTFIAQGPGLRFNSFGRAPAAYYPDYRRLLTETDRDRRRASYVAREEDFQFMKSLEDRNLVVPLVGNFGGTKALAALGNWLRANQEQVTAFYTSNVEQYLFRDGLFEQFARSVRALPRDPKGVMIRSYFQGGHPQNVAGYHATQIMQSLDRFVALTSSPIDYYTLVTTNIIQP